MTEKYGVWQERVEDALRSINMSMDDWQGTWSFDFRAEYEAGTRADDDAMKANPFWWHAQNKVLKQDCRF